ncbi:hypothetical protein U4E84_10100 [Halorubrum sp. AD140]|uniref:hypothetical protein n=1 Tax=Halorubrum sp. AD140 TaxID=3050073 RepID=UPI002ACCE534|nr:hypothetical protein [Halorubrum sp. AD140]MDZ5811693.1 hypothetical protein [Halorubrum sp. AD140]
MKLLPDRVNASSVIDSVVLVIDIGGGNPRLIEIALAVQLRLAVPDVSVFSHVFARGLLQRVVECEIPPLRAVRE